MAARQGPEVDPSTPFDSQLREQDTGPIVIANTFLVPEGSMDKFMEQWRKTALFMKSCPGHISTQMHRGISGSNAMLNVSVWESTEALRAAHTSPQFMAGLKEYPDGSESRAHIYHKMAVDGVCIA